MLVLSRKVGERIQIGSLITLTVLEIRGGKIRLGFDAPGEVPIHREEVFQRIEQEVTFDQSASHRGRPRVDALGHVLRAG